ncbi:amidase family protein [Nocardioides sp. LHG3406-4]|uniref:amidase family protein n=1 Tax=Nocardioides sp. LHG3406-4 TaxID=2804575 RepID=UPI003CF92A6E
MSIGSDFAGSLRIPAHFCGVYAHEPSFALLPSRGHTAPSAPALPYERDLSVIGPMARSAADLVTLLEVLAQPDGMTLGKAHRVDLRRPRHERLSEYRVLVLDTHPNIATSNDVARVVDEVSSRSLLGR